MNKKETEKQKFNKNSKLIRAFSNLSNWKPNFSKISKETEMPVSTIWDFHKKLIKDNRIQHWVEILSEREVRIRELEKKLEEEQQKALKEDADELIKINGDIVGI